MAAALQDVYDSTRLLDAIESATTITPLFTPQAEVERLLKEHQVPPLTDDQERELDEIMEEAERKLVKYDMNIVQRESPCCRVQLDVCMLRLVFSTCHGSYLWIITM